VRFNLSALPFRSASGSAIKFVLSLVFSRFPGLLAASTRAIVARDHLGENKKVSHGLFAGLLMSRYAWNSSDRASIIAGSYETEVQTWLGMRVPKGNRDVINVGAGDGLYAIGLLHSGLASRAFCFETNKISRDSIVANSKVNGLGPDALITAGTFTRLQDHESSELQGFKYEDALFIVDVEGAEFDLLDRYFFKSFRRARGIIEMHDNPENRKANLILVAEEFFEVEILNSSSRNPEDFPLLANLSDDLRWSVMSEGRDKPGEWLGLVPKHSGG